MSGPLVLIIRDGYGIRRLRKGNAIRQAILPVSEVLKEECPHAKLKAAGKHVGLPKGFIGNSEVGHLCIGAGRVVKQMIAIINDAINNGSFYKNEAFLKAVKNVKENSSTLHIMGILQDKGVHGMNTHLYSLLRLAKKNGIKKVKLHLFTDGRDSHPRSALDYLKQLRKKIKKIGIGEISTVIGRYYSMDRDNRWDREKKAYDCLVFGEGRRAVSAEGAVKTAYENKENDEFISPTVIEGYEGINDGDSVIFYNFRLDRGRQLTKAFTQINFNKFKRKDMKIVYVCMTEYYSELRSSKYTMPNTLIAFEKEQMHNILSEVLSKHDVKQLRVAETEKYAHVTYFFNGETEKAFPHEDRILVDSPKVATYDLKPEMSAYEVTKVVLDNMYKYDVVIMNFANADMVGHTGDINATIKAVETIDNCLQILLPRVRELNGVALITADHGNAEEMIHGHQTAHTTNDVDFIVFNYPCRLKRKGSLADIAPTMLHLLGIPIPKEMTGDSLVR